MYFFLKKSIVFFYVNLKLKTEMIWSIPCYVLTRYVPG